MSFNKLQENSVSDLIILGHKKKEPTPVSSL